MQFITDHNFNAIGIVWEITSLIYSRRKCVWLAPLLPVVLDCPVFTNVK